MAAITLYKFPQSVSLNMTNMSVPRTNLPITDADFKVFQGVFNSIDFFIRTNERKPVNLVGRTATVNVFSYYENNSLKLTKDAEILDGNSGKIKVTFTPEDTFKLTSGYYLYSIKVTNPDGTFEVLYTDLDHNGTSYFELIKGVMPSPVDSVVLTPDSFTPVSLAPGVTKYISGAFPGDSQNCQSDGLHTFSILADNYSGKFYVEGSLVEQVSTSDSDWFPIFLSSTKKEFVMDDFTGIEPFNFTANIQWIRFVHFPDTDNSGTIKKILYRN